MDVIRVEKIVWLYCDIFVLEVLFGVKEVTADKGRIDIVFVGPAILVRAMERCILLPFVHLSINVEASLGRAP